jgi:hypothetical protein
VVPGDLWWLGDLIILGRGGGEERSWNGWEWVVAGAVLELGRGALWMEGGGGVFDVLIQEKRRSVTLLSYTRRWT